MIDYPEHNFFNQQFANQIEAAIDWYKLFTDSTGISLGRGTKSASLEGKKLHRCVKVSSGTKSWLLYICI